LYGTEEYFFFGVFCGSEKMSFIIACRLMSMRLMGRARSFLYGIGEAFPSEGKLRIGKICELWIDCSFLGYLHGRVLKKGSACLSFFILQLLT